MDPLLHPRPTRGPTSGAADRRRLDRIDILSFLIPAAALVWVVTRQFVGRFVSMRRMAVLPLVLVVLGVAEAVTAHLHWSRLAIGVVAVDVLITAALGAVRGGAARARRRVGADLRVVTAVAAALTTRN